MAAFNIFLENYKNLILRIFTFYISEYIFFILTEKFLAILQYSKFKLTFILNVSVS